MPIDTGGLIISYISNIEKASSGYPHPELACTVHKYENW